MHAEVTLCVRLHYRDFVRAKFNVADKFKTGGQLESDLRVRKASAKDFEAKTRLK